MKDTLAFFENVLSSKGFVRYVTQLERYGKKGALEKLRTKMESTFAASVVRWKLDPNTSAESVFAALQKEAGMFNEALYAFFHRPELDSVDDWRAVFARVVGSLEHGSLSGWFLKKETAASLLLRHPPKNILRFLGYASTRQMLAKENVLEIVAALRFGEDKRWMYEFFGEYAHLGPGDFEPRPIELMVFDPEKWRALDEVFSGAKLHKLSHLKEFGVIFLVPSFHDHPFSAFQKILGLLLHYVSEVRFYSDFFKLQSQKPDFIRTVIALLKGEIQTDRLSATQIRIIHQYHLKSNHPDPRAFEPHIHPEVLHWRSSLNHMIRWASEAEGKDFSLWLERDYVLVDVCGKIVSMNFSDLAIDHKHIRIYHAFESLWNQIFVEYFDDVTLREQMIFGLSDGYVDIARGVT